MIPSGEKGNGPWRAKLKAAEWTAIQSNLEKVYEGQAAQ
jgi:hypothetical protein